MRQTWHDLLFAHWPVPPERLRALLPGPLRPYLDLRDGHAWVGVVPFRMSGVRPRGVPPLPWLSAFPELNVRTYVTLQDKPGIVFFSLDAANRLAVWAARRLYRLPYFHARMAVRPAGDAVSNAPPATLRGRYRPVGPPQEADIGSLEDWLTARYCLYTVDRRGRIYRGEIDHPPWPLQAAEAEFEVNTMAAAHGIELPAQAPLLHFARRLNMAAWYLERVRT
jgi:uncharacterized protein YqjF (DUF2071 family)